MPRAIATAPKIAGVAERDAHLRRVQVVEVDDDAVQERGSNSIARITSSPRRPKSRRRSGRGEVGLPNLLAQIRLSSTICRSVAHVKLLGQVRYRGATSDARNAWLRSERVPSLSPFSRAGWVDSVIVGTTMVEVGAVPVKAAPAEVTLPQAAGRGGGLRETRLSLRLVRD